MNIYSVIGILIGAAIGVVVKRRVKKSKDRQIIYLILISVVLAVLLFLERTS